MCSRGSALTYVAAGNVFKLLGHQRLVRLEQELGGLDPAVFRSLLQRTLPSGVPQPADRKLCRGVGFTIRASESGTTD